jgi:serine protease Do
VKLRSACLGLGLLVGGVLSAREQRATPQDQALPLQLEFARLAERVLPAVISISAYVRLPEDAPAAPPTNGWAVGARPTRLPGFRRLASSSGFALGEGRGYVTCLHSLLRADGSMPDAIELETHDKRYFLAEIVGAEPTLNLAVLEIVVAPEHAPPKRVALPSADLDKVSLGHWALAMGDPYGPGRFFGVGVFSGQPQRQCYQGDLTATLLQASTAIHPEAYGGPLVNLAGEVCGVLTPRDAAHPGGPFERAVSYALPVDVVAVAVAALERTGAKRSPWLGFSVIEIPALRARLRRSDRDALKALRAPLTGIYLDDVHQASPAAKAGIQVGDFLVAFDGRPLLSVLAFQRELHLAGIGRTVSLELERDGKRRVVELTMAARPDEFGR